MVPYQHLVQLVRLVKGKLNPGTRIGHAGPPHLFHRHRVPIVGTQAQAANYILNCLFRFICARSRGCNAIAGKRISDRLGREAPGLTPNDGGVGQGIHFIDAPVISHAELQTTQIIRNGVLTLTDQHVQGIGPTGLIDVFEYRAKVDIITRRKLSRLPTQHHLATYIDRFVLGMARTRSSFSPKVLCDLILT